MKIRKLRQVAFSMIIALVTLATAQPSFAGQQAKGHRATIVGSWDAEITFGGATSRAMYSFHRDRTLTEADNPGFDPNFGDDALSPGIGSWKPGSRRSGVAKYQKFAYNRSGALNLVYTTTMEMQLNRDGTLTGKISLVIATPDGVVVSEIPNLPFTATRITAH